MVTLHFRRYSLVLLVAMLQVCVHKSAAALKILSTESLSGEWRVVFEPDDHGGPFAIRLRPKTPGVRAPAMMGKWMVLYEGHQKPLAFDRALSLFGFRLSRLGTPGIDPFLEDKPFMPRENYQPKKTGKLRANQIPSAKNWQPPLPWPRHTRLIWVLWTVGGLTLIAAAKGRLRLAVFSIWAAWWIVLGAAEIFRRTLPDMPLTYADGNRIVSRSKLPPLTFKKLAPSYYLVQDGGAGLHPKRKRPARTPVVWIFGESSARARPYGPEYAFGAWAAQACHQGALHPKALFVNIAVEGLNSEGWLRIAQEAVQFTQKGDYWLLFAGHNDHLLPPSAPHPPWRRWLFLPGAARAFWPFAQAKAQQNAPTDYDPRALPFIRTLFAFNPDQTGPLYPFHLKLWGDLAESKGAQPLLQPLPTCYRCQANFLPGRLKPAAVNASRAYVHTRHINRWLYQTAKARRWKILALTQAVVSRRQTLYQRPTFDNHHPTLQLQWWLGQQLARSLPVCRLGKDIPSAPPSTRLMPPMAYQEKMIKLLQPLPDLETASTAKLFKVLKLNEADEMAAALNLY